MKERDGNIWKRKLDWIADRGGMASLNTHPDFMNFGDQRRCREEYAIEHYKEFLRYVRDKYAGKYWHALPRQVARFWSSQEMHKQQSKG